MKILQANAGLLSNYEVMEILKACGADNPELAGSSMTGAKKSECEVFKYLSDLPAVTQTYEAIADFISEAKPFKLTKAELLQAINLRASTAVEVHLVVEDCDERLTPEAVDSLIAIVERTLPPPPVKPEAEGGEEEEEEGGEAGEEEMEAEG
eukprot:TRINITY_DN12171_c0_g2_i1.p1 TRINITY_DN12171_c0_g2~~TRINITY_DN12171_c0_g2_i1.p1  ORF type:complete len:152 (-),score=47.94 TRINITY_DN12171_c0_g2_i1:261-716(-)